MKIEDLLAKKWIARRYILIEIEIFLKIKVPRL